MSSRILMMILVAILCAVPWSHARSAVTAQIVETDPANPSELNSDQTLYIRIAYDSDRPVRFQAAGYLNGSEVLEGAVLNPAPVYAAGKGEALAWIAYRTPTRLDEIHIQVADESWQHLTPIRQRVDVSWNGIASAHRNPAAWASELSAAQQQMVSDNADKYRDEGGAAFLLLFMFAGWSVPGYWVMQIYMWRRYRDEWRKRALLPLWIMLPLLAYTMFALMAGSNLWPLLLIFVSPFAFVYLIGLTIVKRRSEKKNTDRFEAPSV